MDSAGSRLRGLSGLLLAINLGLLAVGLALHYWPRHEALLPAMNAEQIQLAVNFPPARELGKDLAANAAPVSAAEQTGNAEAVRCMAWSRLDSERIVSIEKSLADAGLKAADFAWELDEKIGWWVFLAPLPDAAQRRAAVEAAHALGATDAEAVKTGSMLHAVSLGAFADADHARAFAEQLTGKGLKGVQFGVLPSVATIRLKLSTPPAAGLTESIRQASRGAMPTSCQAEQAASQ